MADRLLSYGDVTLLNEDLGFLRPGQWLNDRLLTFATQFVYEKLDAVKKEKVSLICAPECEAIKFLPQSVEEIFGLLKLHEKELVIFIINDNQNPEIANGGNHWSVLAYSQDTRGYHYYDSLQNRSDHAAREIAENASRLVHSPKPVVFRRESTPQQRNGSDCGIFTIEVIQALLEKGLDGVKDLLILDPSFATERRESWSRVINELATNQSKKIC